MNRPRVQNLLLTLGLIAAFLPACADEQDRVWVVLFAVHQHDNDLFKPNPSAAEQAVKLAALLQDNNRFPNTVPPVQILANAQIPDAVTPTAEHFREAMNRIARDARPGDTLLLIMLTSGLPTNDEFRWLGSDADPDRWPRTSLLSSEIRELIDATRCSKVVSIVDAAFDLVDLPSTQAKPVSDNAWAFAFVALEGDGRLVLASNDGRGRSLDAWSAASQNFWTAVNDGLKGAADRDGNEADGWIDAHELVDFVRGADPQFWTTGRAANAWIARNPEGLERSRQRTGLLLARKEQGKLDERTCETGMRLLRRMPRWQEDRKLRAAFIDYLEGNRSVEDLEAERRQYLTRRNLPENQAQDFAAKVNEAWTLISKYHLDADRAPDALRTGLQALAEHFSMAHTDILQEIQHTASLKPPQLSDALAKLRLRLGRRDGIDNDQATELCLSAMLNSLDPYSAFLAPSVYKQMRDRNSGKFTGIGALLREDPVSKSIVILAPLRDGPAERAELQPDDRIIAIDGIPVADAKVQPASDMLLGPEGSVVTLRIQRDMREPIDVAVRRQTVDIETVVGWNRKPDGQWNDWIDAKNRIAYIRVANFGEETAAKLRRKLLDLQSDGMRALILDLRFNPGGLLEAAVTVTDLFLDDGPIVQIKGRKSPNRDLFANRFASFDDVKLCVLINGWSASGSEILAAALQDNHRAAVAGSRSFGKASVQDVVPMSNERSALKVTSARFFRPNGANLERYLGGRLADADAWGVKPDPDLDRPIYREDSMKLQADLWRRQVLQEPDPPVSDPQIEQALQSLRASLAR